MPIALCLLALGLIFGPREAAAAEAAVGANTAATVGAAASDAAYRGRSAALLQAERGKPLVRNERREPLGPGRPAFTREYSFSLVAFAAKCLLLDEQHGAANAALRENAEYYLRHPEAIYDKDSFHWHAEVVLRLIEFFGTHGSVRAGRIAAEVETQALEAIWLYCKRRDRDQTKHAHLAEADQAWSGTWLIKESENHHVQSFTTLWHFAQIARRRADFRDRRYDDGRRATEHYVAWNDYVKLYLLERARKGLFVETMSVAYNQTLLKGVFNFVDFAEDPELRRRAGLLLDLYFACWGQEQIDGVAGGGRARIYWAPALPTSPLGWVFFGLGPAPEWGCELVAAATTGYRPAPVVAAIVGDRVGRGEYEVVQRPLGLATEPRFAGPPDYRLRTDYGGLVRYSYCTPDFILGTLMGEARPASDWAMISSQNRRHGAIFAGPVVAAILPDYETVRNHRAYNSFWSVQRRGTLIAQKLRTSVDTGDTRIWFSSEGLAVSGDPAGWIFAEAAGAYAAVRVVTGGAAWSNERTRGQGRWLECTDAFTPVILEVARKTRYRSLAEFQQAVTARPIRCAQGVLAFVGLSGDRFTFPLEQKAAPTVNGAFVNYAPARGFDSPFVQSDWDSGVVVLKFADQRTVLDFRAPPKP